MDIVNLGIGIDARPAEAGAAQVKTAMTQVTTSATAADAAMKGTTASATATGAAMASTGATSTVAATGLGRASVAATATAGAMSSTAAASNVATASMRRLETQSKATAFAQSQLQSVMIGFVGGAALLGGAAFTIRTITDFEKSMAILGVTVGATAEEFEALEATARRMGATTRFTAAESADALLELGRAGLTARQSMDALKSVLDLSATAVGIDLATAADYTANIMNQFGLRADETTRIVDALTIVSNRSATDQRQMAEAFKFTGTVASAFGRSLEETAAAIGVLADRNLKASLAGTNLRMIMLNMSNPTNEARRAYAELGMTLADIDPAMNSIADVFERFSEARSDVGAERFAKLMGDIFSSRNIAAALTLTDSIDKMRFLIDDQQARSGETSRQAAVQNATLAGSFKSLESAIQELMLATGENGLLGATQNLIDTGTHALRIVGGITDEATEADGAAQALASAMRVATIAVAAFVGIRVVTHLSALSSAMGVAAFQSYAMQREALALSGTMAAGGVLTRGLQATTIGLTAVGAGVRSLWAAIGPAGWVVLGITAAIEATRLIGNEMNRVSDEALAEEQALSRLTGVVDQLSNAYARLELAQRSNRIEDQIGALRSIESTYRDEAARLQQLLTAGALGSTGTVSNAVDAESIRKLMNDEGKEAFDAFMEGFAQSQINRSLDRPGVRERMTPETVDLLLKDAAKYVTVMPAVDAIRLLSEAADAAEADIKELLKTLTETGEEEYRSPINDFINDLKFEASLLGLTDAARRVSITLREAENRAILSGVEFTQEQRAEITQLVETLEEYEAIEAACNEERDEANRLEAERQKAIETSSRSIDEYVASLRTELSLITLGGLERERATARMRLEAAARGENADKLAITLPIVDELVIKMHELREAEEARSDNERAELDRIERLSELDETISSYLTDLDLEIEMTGKLNEERERAIRLREFQKLVEERYADSVEDALALVSLYDQKLAELADRREEEDALRDLREQWTETFRTIGEAGGQMFESMIFEGESFGDAMENMFERVARAAFQQFVTNALGSMAASLGGDLFTAFGLGGGSTAAATPVSSPSAGVTAGAKGFSFDDGALQKFARGGILESPTFFSHRGGPAVAGEAGSEMVAPLKRDREGNLGVSAVGGGDVHMTVVTQDVGSFERNQRQIMRRTRMMMGGR